MTTILRYDSKKASEILIFEYGQYSEIVSHLKLVFMEVLNTEKIEHQIYFLSK